MARFDARCSFWLLPLLPLLVAASPRSLQHVSSSPGADRRWALLIGVDAYDSEEIADLDYSDDDAERIAAQLIRSGTYAKDHVIVMTTARGGKYAPTRFNIIQQLEWLKGLQGAETVFFLYSGHGGAREADGVRKNYLFPKDTVLGNPVDTAVSLDSVIGALDRSGATRRFVVLDACRTAVAEGQKAVLGPGLQASSVAQGTMVFYATEFGGYSYEDKDAQMGAFSAQLLAGLEGAADRGASGGDGVVDTDELYTFVLERMQVWSSKSNQPQTPYRGGEWTGANFSLIQVPEVNLAPARRGPAALAGVGAAVALGGAITAGVVGAGFDDWAQTHDECARTFQCASEEEKAQMVAYEQGYWLVGMPLLFGGLAVGAGGVAWWVAAAPE